MNLEAKVMKKIRQSYATQQRILEEDEYGYMYYSEYDLKNARKIKGHIETVIRYLDDRSRFIIYNEVIEGKRGTWYLDYFSTTCYYRSRRNAYHDFLTALNR